MKTENTKENKNNNKKKNKGQTAILIIIKEE